MSRRNTAFILVGVLLAMFMGALDQTIVATAAPRIVRELSGLSQLSWAFTAYMLTSTITTPIYGKLSDIFGRRGSYILAIAVFLIGSLLSGISQSMIQLIMFRGLQGIGAGAMMVSSVAIIGDVFPPAERGKWQGVVFAVYGLASIVGPLIGGWITDNLSWRWIFYVNIPVGTISVVTLALVMPKIARDARDRSIDFAGAMLIAVGLIPLLLALVWGGSQYGWASWQIIILLCVAAVALLVFALVERKAREPILSLSLFKNRVFTISIMVILLTTMGLYGSMLYLVVFAQGVIGVSATNSGLILMPMMVGLIVAAALGGQIVARTGKYKVLTIIGMVITVLGTYLFTQIDQNTTNLALSFRMVILGIGMGSTMPVFVLVIQSAFGQEKLGEVTGGSQLFRNLGATLGPAVLGGIMNSQLATRLTNIQNDPFVTLVKQLSPNAAFGKIDANTIQGLLSPAGQSQVRELLAQAPQPMQSQLLAALDNFLSSVKAAFSSSLDLLFVVSTILMTVALIVVVFLPEIKLRKANLRAVSEVSGDVIPETIQADPPDCKH